MGSRSRWPHIANVSATAVLLCCRRFFFKFIFSHLFRNQLSVTSHLEALRVFALASNRIIGYIRTDNEFFNSLISAWATSNKITFISSIPHKHDTVCAVERVHRTLKEMVIKSLALKPHLSPEF